MERANAFLQRVGVYHRKDAFATHLSGGGKKRVAIALTVYIAARDPRTPMLVRMLALLVATYAFSPIDLIPDFIPVIGYLNDLLIVTLGLALVIRLTPPEVLEAARAKALQAGSKPVSYTAAACFVVLWLIGVWLAGPWLIGYFGL